MPAFAGAKNKLNTEYLNVSGTPNDNYARQEHLPAGQLTLSTESIMLNNKHNKKIITFLGIPYFPITVERAFSKRLLKRPIVVSQTTSSRSTCLSASSEAQSLGIRAGMPLYLARRYCRDLTILSPNPQLYLRAMKVVGKVVAEYSPLFEISNSGQCYMDLTGCERLFGNSISVVRLIRKAMIDQFRLSSDAGIAANKLVSRVAAIDANKEGVLEVEAGAEEPFMAPHHVKVLPSVDKAMKPKLSELNLQFVQQIKNIDLETLLLAVGPAALSLSRQAQGIDSTPVISPGKPPEIVFSEDLKNDTNHPDILHSIVKRMTIEGIFTLIRSGKSAGAMNLKLSFCDGREARNTFRTRRLCQDSTWLKIAENLLKRTLTRRVRIKSLEIVFSRIANAGKQLSLWDDKIEKTDLFSKLQVFTEPNVVTDYTTSISAIHNWITMKKSLGQDRLLGAMKEISDKYGDKSLNLGWKH